MSKTNGKILVILLSTFLLLVAASGQAAGPPVTTSGPTAASPADPPSKSLPVEELPVPDSTSDVLVIILSGDGGWADLDRDFGTIFQQRGIATLGFDCLKYFWKPRHPAEVAGDLETILTYYLKAWQKKRVVLIGYSFGASWLPLLIDRLPADLQERISLVVLLAPGSYTNIEIKVGDWFRDSRHPGALEVTEAAKALRRPLLCVYGMEEKDDSICPQLEGKNRRIMPVPGGHHFNHNYAPIEETILKYLK